MAGSSLGANLKSVIAKMHAAAVKCGRDPESVRLIAVSKEQPPERVQEAYGYGQRLFGENYVQEALSKKVQIAHHDVQWHFIGSLQRNKVKMIVGKFALIHSVDSLALAEEISLRAGQLRLEQPILIQVKIGGEENKSGIDPSEAELLVKRVVSLPHLSLHGLMAIPPPTDEVSVMRSHFQLLRELHSTLRTRLQLPSRHPFGELSMGMSSDFEIAIEEGATMVRVGTLIFGPRAPKK